MLPLDLHLSTLNIELVFLESSGTRVRKMLHRLSTRGVLPFLVEKLSL